MPAIEAFFAVSTTTATTLAIREDVLRDPRYPVHKIADRLLPYLRVLVEQFHPEQVILFGSCAYGHPDLHSDVDLLVVKELERSPVKEAAAILKLLGDPSGGKAILWPSSCSSRHQPIMRFGQRNPGRFIQTWCAPGCSFCEDR